MKRFEQNVNDGAINGVSVIMGRNFADNKGNGTLFLAYKKENAVTEASRDFSACSLNAGANFQASGCGGSSTAATGRYTNLTTGARFTQDTNPASPTFNGGNGVRGFNNGLDLFDYSLFKERRSRFCIYLKIAQPDTDQTKKLSRAELYSFSQ